jgi:hypothetical protein
LAQKFKNIILLIILILCGLLSLAQCPNANFEFGNFREGDYYVQNDVYEYKVTWKGIDNEPEIIFGHVTVVR